MTLEGRKVLVIGGGSGIGFAVAKAAVAEGARVAIASTDFDKLNAAANKLGNAETARFDVKDEAAVRTYFEAAGTIDHIVFTAGDWSGARRAGFTELDLASAETLFRVRFWGAVAVAKYGATCMPPGGSITLTAGMSAHRPQKGSAIATAMAGAVEHLTRGLAVELAPIRVNAVCPGAIHTEIWSKFPEHLREIEFARIRRQLLPRIGEPEEAAQAYLYLMRGGYTTGQILFVEGGSALGA
jgi:NAD(P)-dependent dehydrogenase (short-subunit alcohol dehydrogenase family)